MRNVETRILIRCGELSLQVSSKKMFTQKLASNIKSLVDFPVKVIPDYDFMYLDLRAPEEVNEKENQFFRSGTTSLVYC